MRTDRPKRNEAQQRSSVRDEQAKASAAKGTKAEPINWNEWWPFERATGDALKQLNGRRPKFNPLDEFEDALL